MRIVRFLFVGAIGIALFAGSCITSNEKHCCTETTIKWKQLTEKPPMGWNSWDSYDGALTEAQFRPIVDTCEVLLKPFGYDYMVVDMGWYVPGPADWNYVDPIVIDLRPTMDSEGKWIPESTMDEYGRFLPDPKRFPSSVDGQGFKPLADYVHSKGMKFGIHIMRGIPRQAVDNYNTPILGTTYHAADIAVKWDTVKWSNLMYGVKADHPASQAYYNSIFNLYASWGVDFIKADDMMVPPYHKHEIEMMRKAIDQCGRPMVLSLSCGENPISQANHLEAHANMYRISIDVWDHWYKIERMFELLKWWSPFIGDGTWPDADMLPLGRLSLGGDLEAKRQPRFTNFTPEEQYTMMSLWSIARSPLFFGGDPLTLDDFTLKLLTNKEIIEVNQNSLNNRQVYHSFVGEEIDRVWMADIPGSDDKYLGLFNLSDEERVLSFDFRWEYLPEKMTVRDLWQQKDLGTYDGKFEVTLAPHGGRLYRISPSN